MIESTDGSRGTAVVRIASAVPAVLRPRKPGSNSPGKAMALADAEEYLLLSIKRWKYYSAQGFAMPGLPAARSAITADSEAELGFLLLAECVEMSDGILGFCFVRRVWTGRLVVDFLSVHPGIFSRTTGRPAFGGLGSGLLASVAKLTLQLGGTGFWGEATKGSHGFYRHMRSKIRTEEDTELITDHFRFEGPELVDLTRRILLPE